LSPLTNATADQPVLAGETTDPGAPPSEPAPEPDAGAPRWIGWAATAAVCLPIAFATVRGLVRGWRPTGDDAFIALRATDVFSSHTPLIGSASAAAEASGRTMNHPGPLLFDALAVPVQLLGPSVGTAVGVGLVNIAAVVVIAWLVRRQFGTATAALAMGLCGLLTWSIGSELLYDPWNPFAALLPFAAFLVAAWSVASGDLPAAPVAVVAGSLVLQTHLSYSVLVPGVAVVTVGMAVARFLADRGRGRELLRWGLIAVAAGLVAWGQPLYEQFVAPEGPYGNLSELARNVDTEKEVLTTGEAVSVFGGTVALPPMWLAPSFGDPRFDMDDLVPPWLAGGALVLLVAALGLTGWRAFRRGSTAAAAGTAIALAGLTFGFATALRMPLAYGALPRAYGRFMWPLGMVVWLALAVALVDELRAVRPLRRPRVLAGVGLLLAVVGACGIVPTADHSGEPAWPIDALNAVDDDVLAAIDEAGGGPVVFDTGFNLSSFTLPALWYTLQDAGVEFYVTDAWWGEQIGMDRVYEEGDHARLLLSLRSGPAPPEVDGARRVAYWSDPDPELQPFQFGLYLQKLSESDAG
jgi:hypothetical protein